MSGGGGGGGGVGATRAIGSVERSQLARGTTLVFE